MNLKKLFILSLSTIALFGACGKTEEKATTSSDDKIVLSCWEKLVPTELKCYII